MVELIKAAEPTLRTVAILAAFVGISLAGFGVWLVYLGSVGHSEVLFFGQKLNTTEAGIPAIFIGGVLVIMVFRGVLRTITHAIDAPPK
jgi:hypothetical protein